MLAIPHNLCKFVKIGDSNKSNAGMIHPDSIELILDKTRIEEVIGDFISLKKSGTNYKGCCPFHNEKTPSFMVSPAKGIFKCFGCSKGGTAVSFIMDHEKIGYVDALKYLAKKYNVEVIETQVSEEDIQKKSIRESLQIVNAYAAQHFAHNLLATQEGTTIGLSYFKEREFTQETIETFGLGYSIDSRDGFTKEAQKNGHNIEFLKRVGLTIEGENDTGGTYLIDRFRARVMFPIHNLTGNIIGFGGRIVGNNPQVKLAKYLNSPESELYVKSKSLYGIYFARTHISKLDECVLVEGYTDVMRMHQQGVKNVVASSGTSLTVEQIQLIKRFTNNVLVVFDNDSAGIKASFRGINMILEAGMHVKILLLPEGDDPDSFAKQRTQAEIEAYINEHKADFITFKTQYFAEESKNDPIERAKVINDIVHSIAVIPNQIEQSVYVAECSKLLKISEDILFSQIQKIHSQKKHTPSALYLKKNEHNETAIVEKKTDARSVENLLYYNEFDILRLLITFGDMEFSHLGTAISVKHYIYKEIVEGDMLFTHEVLSAMFDIYYTYTKTQTNDLHKFLLYHENTLISNVMIDINSTDKTLSTIWSKKESYVETEDKKLYELVPTTIYTYKKRRLELEADELVEALKTETNEDTIETITYKYINILNVIKEISKELHHVV